MRIVNGEFVRWQRKHNNPYKGVVVAFCPVGTKIKDALDLSQFEKYELRRIYVDDSGINRYLIYVDNIGIVSVAAGTIERQNPEAKRN